MTLVSSKHFGTALLAVCLTLSCPVHAQNAGNPATPPAQGGGHWEGTGSNPEFQQLREERDHIRKEHEDLKAARDSLREKCQQPSPQLQASCVQEKKELHERAEKLHERMRALHEKMDALRKEHGDTGHAGWQDRHAEHDDADASPATP